MNWLKNLVRPKLLDLVGANREGPDDPWRRCPRCGQMLFHRDVEKNLNVCQHCDHHMRMGAVERLTMLFDEGTGQVIEMADDMAIDPLKFRDRRKYADRLKEAGARTGAAEAVTVGHGRMGGTGVVIAVLDFEFMDGTMGMAVGEGLIAAARLSVLQDVPLIVVSSSGGARVQEGIFALMQMPRTAIAVDHVRQAGLPYIVVLADPTTGGSSASFAMLGDVAIAEPGAVIGFAGPRVTEQTMLDVAADGAQPAETLADHGMVDMVVHRHDLRKTLVRIVRLLRDRTPTAEVVALPGAANDAAEEGQAAG